jgi:hypothetical protein
LNIIPHTQHHTHQPSPLMYNKNQAKHLDIKNKKTSLEITINCSFYCCFLLLASMLPFHLHPLGSIYKCPWSNSISSHTTIRYI